MAAKKNTITKDSIIAAYMDYRLKHAKKPHSVYQFSNENGFEEAVFYSFFGTLESIEKEIFKVFFEKTFELIQKSADFENSDMKTKLLIFYFTIFEVLTANRSYVLMSLTEHKNQLKNISQLSSLKIEFKKFIEEIISDEVRTQFERFQNLQEKAIKETAWIQFLVVLKFWMEDKSAAFEKTDIFIEKSLKASFEIINVAPIESIIDFGKFLYKEKMQKN